MAKGFGIKKEIDSEGKAQLKHAIFQLFDLEERWQFEETPPDKNTHSMGEWQWVVAHLLAYLSGKDIPWSESLDEKATLTIQTRFNYYAALSVLVYQSCEEIQAFAEELETPYPFESFSELVRQLMFEDFFADLLIDYQDCYESLSASQQAERSRDSLKFLENGEMPKEATLKRWRKENSKLVQDFDPGTCRKWTLICTAVFQEHRSKLPAYDGWIAALKQFRKLGYCKFAVLNGERRKYPARGKAKA